MTSYADVHVTIRIKNCGSWGDECTAAQIRDQATKTALGKLYELRVADQVEIVGEPEVRAIVAPIPKP